MAWKKTPPALIEAFEAALPRDPRVEARKMFGYPAAFVSSHMFAGTHEERLLIRLPEDERNALLAHPGAKPFEPMPGRVMREYVVAPPDVVAAPRALADWLAKAFTYAAALPPKRRKGSKSAAGASPRRAARPKSTSP
jgi:TfoX/Sxy family transcriptional regulator of competence genes